MKNVSIYHACAVLLFGILLIVALYYGRLFFIPLFFAILLSMLMTPVSNWLERKGIGRVWATLICILLIILFIAAVLLAISLQAASFSQDLPQIQKKLQETLSNVQQWIQQQFGVAPEEQLKFMQEQISKLSQSVNTYVKTFLSGALGLITSFVLVILYMFFLMWRREKYQEFLLRLFSSENSMETKKTIEEITQVSSQYLIGRVISMLFLWVCYSIGFSIIGLDNALLLSVIAVLPTIVPYIGAFVGGLFPILMSFVSGSTGMIIPVVAILAAAQTIDNNIIEPLVMGAKMDLSPIFTVVAIVLGQMLWGVAGMVLFVPMFAVIRIICQHVSPLKPYGFLLEDELGEPGWVKKLKQKFTSN
ncbi:AI-2E family transporter [Rufibacter roseus]|uniref:AI-2E family transporter n=1 Tax=Rufibacter roseus TaxID=1567108 RepID=A0ABW2DQ64_9BACT|nr:AI-2E family transporter [Rufibacter roseus]